MALVDAHSLVMVSRALSLSLYLPVRPESRSLLSHEILPPSPSPTGFSQLSFIIALYPI